jgi:exocyst complex component 5
MHLLIQETNKQFELLNSRLGLVGNTAIRIGEQLETIDKHKKRASEAKDLIQYVQEFNAGQFSRLLSLRQDGFAGEFQTAIILRRLNTIVQEMDIMEIENVCTFL